MEIINTITVEAGWSVAACITGGFMLIMDIVILILAIRAWHSLNFSDKFWCIFSLIFALTIAIGLPLKTRIPVAYNKYDVLFTKPIDINDLYDKYVITGRDGNIWHLEDIH